MNGAWDRTLFGRQHPGQAAERTRRISMADVEAFTAITGDRNPLHYDAALAAASPFGGLIVQGGVTSGLLNAAVAEELPGPGTVFLGVEWRFVKAVKVGEEITARVEVLTVRDDKPICTLATTVRNAAGEACLTGTAVTWTAPLRGSPRNLQGIARPTASEAAAEGRDFPSPRPSRAGRTEGETP